MKLFLNNMDGAGPVDYTAALCSEKPLRVSRRLNMVPTCSALLDLSGTGLPWPVKSARLNVVTDAGVELFTGYVTNEPTRDYAGTGVAGPVFRLLITAAGDEWLVGNELWSVGSTGITTHTVTEADGAWEMNALSAENLKQLATDVTLTGELEPTAMIQEIFIGDGTTAAFNLSEKPFHQTPTNLLNDEFGGPTIDATLWSVNDLGGHVSLTGTGLTFSGGTGFDGQTTVASRSQIEMGGSLMVEASRVEMHAGSSGVLCGLYQGVTSMANLFAGFRVKVDGGGVVIVPIMNGAEVGTSFAVADGHIYTLRLRVYCVETQRVMETYSSLADGVVHEFGGGLVDASTRLTFEVQDLGLSSATPVSILYDGNAMSSPAMCSLVAANAIQLFGGIGAISVSRPASAWVVSTLSSGVVQTRLIGDIGDGVDCSVDSNGKVTFYPGREPAPNERVTVFYRNGRRAVARIADAASVANAGAMGLPDTPHWMGKVTSPHARSSVDCGSAAQAFLSLSTSRSVTQAGKYVAMNPIANMKPGNLLQIVSGPDTVNAVVHEVVVEDQQCVPEMLLYTVSFANNWGTGVSMSLAEGVAADASLPSTAEMAPLIALENLQNVSVVNVTHAVLQLDAGQDAPSGGGFEVRKRDWDFNAGTDSDLVLRSPVRSLEIPRAAKDERYFVRMYDASDPPVYSRFSAAVFTHVPVA